VLELAQGHQLLLVSAYMPSGLDHLAAASEEHDAARALYAELLGWSAGMQQVLVLGDLNETLTQWDREPQSAARVGGLGAAAASSPLHTLVADGFTDVFRHLHPDAVRNSGFTHVLDGARPSRSRIDYIWSKEISAASLLRCEIDASLRALSHHRLLWAELQLQQPPAAGISTPLLQLRLPNLRAATAVHKQKFARRVEMAAKLQQYDLEALSQVHTTAALQQLTAALTALLHDAAAASFPITGAAPLQSACILKLQQQRRSLSRLIKHSSAVLASARGTAFSNCLVQNAEWRRQLSWCQQQFPSLKWDICAWSNCNPHAWISNTRVLLNRTRSAIRREQQRMSRAPQVPLSECSAAHVHRMLKSDALPSHLQSVVNARGQLTSSAEELESVMVDHFSSVFAMPQIDPTPLPHPPPAMLFDKSSVEAQWFDGLMIPVGRQEVFKALADAKFVSSPGEDGVSTGLWKLALEGSDDLCSLVVQLFSGCLALSFFPPAWKTSVIVPLVKDDKKERTMSNVRPISLQSCLGKLFMKVLAHRLGGIFARHPILNPAQRGFIHGGSIAKCIDELLDAWEHGRTNKSEMYTLFYDIAQAYDSVQRDVLLRAMRRLRMPASFVELVSDSLTGLTSCVRTAYGVSRHFDVQRSLRQGCPLAPLLFVVLMDALHDGLERNPFTGKQAGLELKLMPNASKLQMASLGYADDTNVLASSLANLRILNDWMHYFLRFNALRLNHSKCELVGRGADNTQVTAAAIAAAGITIEGHAIVPVDHCTPIRYLGVHCRFDGDWSGQHAKSTAMIQLFVRAISKFQLSVQQAVYMISVFLLPKLELGLRYITGPQVNAWIRGYDASLVGSLKHVIASPLSLSHSAVALTAGFLLPSWLEVAVKVSELFIRLNTTDSHDRWSRFGRQFMLLHVGAVTAKRNADQKDRDAGTRFQRAAAHAVNHLQWKLVLREELSHARGVAARNAHLFARQPVAGMLLSSNECSSMQAIDLTAGPSALAHDCWTGWGSAGVPRTVHVYTDGSFDAHTQPKSTSAWAVTIGDRWLDDNFARLPTDEQLINAAEVGGATLVGASITVTSGVYPAELQAIARALAAFPLPCSLHIHSDSQASIAGIRSYFDQLNSRQRLRMAARPLLQLIHHQIKQREAAGGSVQLEHVRAHSAAADIHSVGNRLTDYRANTARVRPQSANPSTLRELPLAECEHHLTVWTKHGEGQQVIDDVRRSAIAQLKAQQLSCWHDKPPADTMDGTFACPALLDSSREVLAKGSPSQQAAFMHIATNSIQCCWQLQPDGITRKVQPLWCGPCNTALTLLHLSTCAANTAFRDRQRDAVLAELSVEAGANGWLSVHKHLPLEQLLVELFPPPSATPLHLHIVRTMCGVLSTRQANAACKLLGVKRAKDARALMQQLRLCCIDGVSAFYAALKLALP
jgi:ribonuclease HI